MNRKGVLKCTLLSQGEVERVLSRGIDNNCWLEKPSGSMLIEGVKPKGIENNQAYLRILEQIQFFHGDVKLLLKHPSPVWCGSLAPDEARALMKKILSNPLFEENRQFYQTHQDEFNLFFENAKIAFIEEKNKPPITAQDRLNRYLERIKMNEISNDEFIDNIIEEIKEPSLNDKTPISHFLFFDDVTNKMKDRHSVNRILETLVEQKIDYEEKTASPYMSLLNIAVINKDTELATTLIHKYKLNIMDFHHDPPNLLAKAIENKDTSMIALLINNGADFGLHINSNEYGKYSEAVTKAINHCADEKIKKIFYEYVNEKIFPHLSIEQIIKKIMLDNNTFTPEACRDIELFFEKNKISRSELIDGWGETDISKKILSAMKKTGPEFHAEINAIKKFISDAEEEAEYERKYGSKKKMLSSSIRLLSNPKIRETFLDSINFAENVLPQDMIKKVNMLYDAIENMQHLGEKDAEFNDKIIKTRFHLLPGLIKNARFDDDSIIKKSESEDINDFLKTFCISEKEYKSFIESVRIFMSAADTMYDVFEFFKNTDHHLNQEESEKFAAIVKQIEDIFEYSRCDPIRLCALIKDLSNIVDASKKNQLSPNLADEKTENTSAILPSNLDPSILKCAQIVIPDVAREFFRSLEEHYTNSENMLHALNSVDNGDLKKGFNHKRVELEIQLSLLENKHISLEDFKKCVKNIDDIMYTATSASFKSLEECANNTNNSSISEKINLEKTAAITRQNVLRKGCIEPFSQDLTPNELEENVRQNLSHFYEATKTKGASTEFLKESPKLADFLVPPPNRRAA